VSEGADVVNMEDAFLGLVQQQGSSQRHLLLCLFPTRIADDELCRAFKNKPMGCCVGPLLCDGAILCKAAACWTGVRNENCDQGCKVAQLIKMA
jgi:hypothetical protein